MAIWCAHIVGCGQDEYVRCFEDPAHVAARANGHGFTEGFKYLFHREELALWTASDN